MIEARQIHHIPARRALTNRAAAARLIRLAVYCRVSTDEEDQLESFANQQSYYQRYVRNHPEYQLVDIFADEGITGLNTRKRDQFKRMIEECEAGHVDMIITKSISRMFRNTADCLLYTRELKKRGIGVLFEEQNINTLDSTGELMLTILSSLAQDESRNISENTTWGIRSRFQQGHLHLNTNRFLGYDKDKDGNLIINPDQAKLVRRIYDSFLDGISPDTIASQFRNEKIPTIMGTSNWQASTIYGILRNEKYKGDVLLQKWYTSDFLSGTTVRNNGEVEQYYIKGNHEPIIEPVRWEVTQLELARREAFREKYGLRSLGRYTANQPFSNRVFCGLCNDLFWRRTWYRLGKDVKVWQCNKRYKEKGVVGCTSKNLFEHQLHGAFIRAWNTVVAERNSRMATWAAQMAGDDQLAAFYAERFMELTASEQMIDKIDMSIVAKVLERTVFYGDHLDFFLLDGSTVTVKLDE